MSQFPAQINLNKLNGRDGFALVGEETLRSGYPHAGDRSGWSVASAGDVNADGFADLIVGAPYADLVGPFYVYPSGASYEVFGKASGFDAKINLSTLDGSNGFKLRGGGDLNQNGSSVASAGDVNGDGFAEVIVGADGAGVS